MTTIAIKDGVMACESKEAYDDGMIATWDAWKVALHNDAYYGFCGSSHHINVVMDTIRGNAKLEDLSPEITLQFIKMPKAGKPLLVYLSDGHVSQEPITKNGYAIGSGMPYAMVAMSCGKSAVEAVKEAIKWDCFSGGKVKSYSFARKVQSAPKEGKITREAARKAVRAVIENRGEKGVFDDWSDPDDKA